MRCVFDTNIIISALLFKDSVPGMAFYLAMSHGTILISLETTEELIEVISRRKFDKYLTVEEREEFLESILIKAEIVEVMESLEICRDPKDDKFLNLAASGSANYIVTGDDDLLILKIYGGVQVLNARDFIELFD